MAALAEEAASLSRNVGPGWYRSQATALAAAARVASGGALDLASVVDAEPPPIDVGAPERLAALLPEGSDLAQRMDAHRASMTVPSDRLEAVAGRLMALLFSRANEDLGLPADVPPPRIEVRAAGRRFEFEHDRLVLDNDRRWTVVGVLDALGEAIVPGGYLANRLRPDVPAWGPSPQTTIDHGMRSIAREVLLADHELAHELGRIGRDIGVRWHAERIVAVDGARGALAPAFAAAAVTEPHDADALRRLGVDATAAAATIAAWADPLARAECVARAAGPAIVRPWLVRVGQTTGLARLLTEQLAPSLLRAELANA